MARRQNMGMINKDVPHVVDDIIHDAVNPETGFFKYSKEYLEGLSPQQLNKYLESLGTSNRIMYNKNLYDKLMSGKELDEGDLWRAYNAAREQGFEYDSDQVRKAQLASESIDDNDKQILLAEIISSIEEYAAGKQDAAAAYEQIEEFLR